MKTNNPIRHFSHDELLIAVVDQADLESERRAHLDECASCRQALIKVKNRLTRLGRMANQLAPEPSRPFRLPEKSNPSLHWMFKPAWATAGAMILLLAITFWQPHWLTGRGKPEVTPIDLSADRRLMLAVDALVDNALPEAYQQLASLSEPRTLNDATVDEDLMDWIVPPLEEEKEHDDSLS